MSKPRVFVSRLIPANGLKILRSQYDVSVWEDPLPPTAEQLAECVAGCSGLVTLLSDRIDASIMDAAGPSLKVISNYAVGYNNIDVAEAKKRGIRIGNTPKVLTGATADMAVCLMLAAARQLKAGMNAVREGEWKTWEPRGYLGWDLKGRTVGILGAGRIGLEFARRCRGGWGMDVMYCSRSRKPRWSKEFDASFVTIDELFEYCDIVSIHCPLTEETRGMVNADCLEFAKEGCILINTARGEIVDQDALYDALTNGPLSAAGLDVTDPEPLPPDHPLVGLPNCVISPHTGSATHEAREAMAHIAAANVILALRGEAMEAEVKLD